MFDTYENKVWENGAIVHDGILQRNCTSIVPLDRNNNIYTNTSGNADVVFFDKDGKYISTLNFYKDKVANSPRGKELLEKQLNNIRTKKDSIIEEANRELELFKKFQIAAQANPKLTYVEFCKTINNE